MRALILALAILSTPAAAAEQQQFDLICTGIEVPTRYRVDLAKNEACSGECDRIWTMGEHTSGQLKLIENVPFNRDNLEERMTVNRQTGAYQYFVRVPGMRPDSKEGSCEPAEFSGFPAARF